jgi:hypothetical protein
MTGDKMIRARTVDEYVSLIRDAIYEVDEMRASLEFDEDSMSAYAQFIDDLESSLKELYQSMLDGSYCWRTGDLAYMEVIRNLDDKVMPIRALLTRINETHKNGLEPE